MIFTQGSVVMGNQYTLTHPALTVVMLWRSYLKRYKRFRFISLHSAFYLLNKFGGKTILPKEMRRTVEKLRVVTRKNGCFCRRKCLRKCQFFQFKL